MNKKLQGFTEGNEYGFYRDGKLCLGTIWLCEKCNKPASVNAMQVEDAPRSVMTKLAKSAILFEMKGFTVTELSCDEEGNNLCESCYQ